MQFASTAKQATAILFDSDFGRTIDSVLALALLHGFAGKLQARVSALTINYPCLQAAQLCDVVERFYRRPVTNPAAAYMSAPAIGIVDPKGKLAAGEPALVKVMLSKPGEGGKPQWQSNISRWNDTALPEVLMRNDLAAQRDGNAVMVMTGPATNMSRLLALHDTRPLIAAKVKMLVIGGGSFAAGHAGQPDTIFGADAAAAKHVLAEWPTPVVFCGREIGNQLLFPGQCIDRDFSYAPAHPVVDAYRSYHAMPYDAPSCALAAMLYAIRPAETYFTVSKSGTVSLKNDGHIAFVESAEGKHSYLSVAPAKHDLVIQQFTEMVSAKPVFVDRPRNLPKDVIQKDDKLP